MWKKIIFLILVGEILISWPLSLIRKKAVINYDTIFYPVTQEENFIFQKKLALDTSFFKKFFYNKTTILKDRYIKNILINLDFNNYFFAMHPREDISGVDYRFKYPWWAIIFLIPAIKVIVNNKKYFKIWLIFLLEIMILSFFRKMDGWDFILFFPISYLLYLGAKDLLKYKYSWLVNLALIFLMVIEIGRIF